MKEKSNQTPPALSVGKFSGNSVSPAPVNVPKQEQPGPRSQSTKND